MDQAYLHFLFNHFPILGTLFGTVLLAWGLLRRDKSLENAGLIFLLVMALLTLPAFFTGEAAEELAENIEGVSEHFIEEHEELAEKGLWIMIALGIFSLATLTLSFMKKKGASLLKFLTLLLGAGAFALMVFIGKSGGEIRHSELRKTDALNQEKKSPEHED